MEINIEHYIIIIYIIYINIYIGGVAVTHCTDVHMVAGSNPGESQLLDCDMTN